MKYLKTSMTLLGALPACSFGLLLATAASAQQAPLNIALNKPVSLSPAPNYGLCSDPEDTLQLTDGKFAGVPLWVHKETVGWNNISPAVITIDLGTVQPISGVSYSAAAGIAGVSWPTAIYIGVSDDGQSWHYAGDLVPLSKKVGEPPAEGYAAFRYTTQELQTKGRYISLGVIGVPFAFVDEVEVYKGNDAWLGQPARDRISPDMSDLVKRAIVATDDERRTSHARRRLDEDIAAIREEITKAKLPENRTRDWLARLDKNAQAAWQMQAIPVDFKTTLPLNGAHRDILAVHGEVLSAQGLKPLTVWKRHRYANLSLLSLPDTAQKARLDIAMLRRQFRSDALLLTNATGTQRTITLQVKNAPRGAAPGWLKLYSAAWIDTAQGLPVASALLPLAAQNGIYKIAVPGGMTGKVWFAIDSSKLSAGTYSSTVEVKSATDSYSVPFSLNVSKIEMGNPRFSTGVWDYTNVPKYGAVNPENKQAAIALMRSHFVDTPWATDAALPFPAATEFDAQGNLKAQLDFTNFDAWVARWPGARRYFVYAAVGDSFAGVKIDAAEFAPRVGSWARALSAHIKSLKLNPKQLGLLLVDEPASDGQDIVIAAWAKAINAAAPELTLFSDPTWERPDQAKIQDAFTEMDILCSYLPVYKKAGEPVRKYFENLRTSGKELWFYQFDGPVRTFAPQSYYRYQPWQAFSISATGQGFWAFGDTGGAPSSWNEYSTTRNNDAPAFVGKDTVHSSLHWEALREGIEDYEELAMLGDAIEASKDAAWKTRAQQILDNAVAVVTGSWTGDNSWKGEKDPALADTQLAKVRRLLTQ